MTMSNIFTIVDEELYSKFPELKGKRLGRTPEDKFYRQEYMKILKEKKKSNSIPDKEAGSSQQKCMHTHGKEEIDEEKKECVATSLSILKEKLDYQLVIPGTNAFYKGKQYTDINTFEIVAGPKEKPVTINIKADGLSGPCADTHTQNAFSYIDYDFDVISNYDTELKFSVYSTQLSKENSISAYISLVKFLFKRSPIVHNIDYTTCGFKQRAIVKVFPSLLVKASVSVNYEWVFSKKGKSLELDKSPTAGLYNKLKYSFKVSYDGYELVVIDQQNKQKTEVDKFLEVFFDKLEYLNAGFSAFLSDSQTLKINISPSISGSYTLKEVAGMPFVDEEYKFSVGFKPLLSMKADADISGKLLLAVPFAGPFLLAAVSTLEKLEKAEVFLGFKVKGEISVDATFTKEAGGKLDNDALSFVGKVTIDLQGKVAGTMQLWKLQYSLGTMVGAHSAFEVKNSVLMNDDTGLYFPIDISFLGITVYMQAWSTLGVSEKTSRIPKSTNKKEMYGGKEMGVDKMAENDKMVIVEPYKFTTNVYIVGGSQSESRKQTDKNDNAFEKEHKYAEEQPVLEQDEWGGGGGRFSGGGSSGNY